LLINCFTTDKFTSASSRAMRTSRIAPLTSSSVSLPLSLSLENICDNLSLNPLNAPIFFSLSTVQKVFCLTRQLCRVFAASGYLVQYLAQPVRSFDHFQLAFRL